MTDQPQATLNGTDHPIDLINLDDLLGLSVSQLSDDDKEGVIVEHTSWNMMLMYESLMEDGVISEEDLAESNRLGAQFLTAEGKYENIDPTQIYAPFAQNPIFLQKLAETVRAEKLRLLEARIVVCLPMISPEQQTQLQQNLEQGQFKEVVELLNTTCGYQPIPTE